MMEGEFDDALALANGSPVVPARPEDRRAPEDRRMPEGHWDPGAGPMITGRGAAVAAPGA